MLLVFAYAQNEKQLIYNGFHRALNLHLDGLANILPNGLLQMTNFSIHKTAHAYYPYPMTFRPNQTFSTTFVFVMYSQVTDHSGHGIVFVISQSMSFQGALSSK